MTQNQTYKQRWPKIPGRLILDKAAPLICTLKLEGQKRFWTWNATNNVVQQVKRTFCPYYLTLKIMSNLHVLLSNWNQRTSTNLSGLIFFFSKIAINEKGEINAIPIMTVMNMISPFDRPQLHRGDFYQRNLLFQCTLYLPVQLTPKYSGLLQIHRKDPLVLWHLELLSQLCFSVAHSLTSEKQEMLLFSLSFFLYIVFDHKRTTEKQFSRWLRWLQTQLILIWVLLPLLNASPVLIMIIIV